MYVNSCGFSLMENTIWMGNVTPRWAESPWQRAQRLSSTLLLWCRILVKASLTTAVCQGNSFHGIAEVIRKASIPHIALVDCATTRNNNSFQHSSTLPRHHILVASRYCSTQESACGWLQIVMHTTLRELLFERELIRKYLPGTSYV